MSSVFVWYRVADDSPHARAVVAALLHEVRLRTGVRGRMYARRDDRGTTWMEVYETISDAGAFDDALADAVRACGADALAVGGRHAERFAAIEPE